VLPALLGSLVRGCELGPRVGSLGGQIARLSVLLVHVFERNSRGLLLRRAALDVVGIAAAVRVVDAV
jgi:hypothetical protein